MITIAELLAPYVFWTYHFALLVANYGVQRRLFPLEQLYSKMRKNVPAEQAREFLVKATSPAIGDAVFTLCEWLIAR